MNLIQSSSQALAEMREKIRILVNEVRAPPSLPPLLLQFLEVCLSVCDGDGVRWTS